MKTIADVIPPAALNAAVEAGHIACRQHPTLPLSIYTYTRAAQYSRTWTPATLRCRGLIADDKTGEIIAWPFPKFFNVDEHALGFEYAAPLPDEPFKVYDKVDGSLGIVFHYDGRWHVASKGSFTSEQAQWAQHWIDSRPTGYLVPGNTYLAEIVYPANRIVVDYGQRQDLVLLGAYNADGREWKLDFIADDWVEIGSVVRTWPALPLDQLLQLAKSNTLPDGQQLTGMGAEGYVIRYANGVRAKAKLAEYVRLHKVLTGINEKDIWRYLGIRKFRDQPAKLLAKALGCPASEIAALSSGKDPLEALLELVPDEFDQWVQSVVQHLDEHWGMLQERAAEEFATIAHLGGSRAEFARAAQTIEGQAVRACMFLMLDGRATDLHLWRAIKPESAAPFADDDEA